MDALAQEDEEQAKKRAEALRVLKEMKFDEETRQRAEKALKPQFNHRTQIEKIVKQLGLAPNGDIAKLWIELTKAYGRVHERSFHERLEVDETFRTEFARKFDTVIRAVVTQLEDRYTAFHAAGQGNRRDASGGGCEAVPARDSGSAAPSKIFLR